MVLCSTGVIILNNRKVIDNLVNNDNTINNNVYMIVNIALLFIFTAIPAVLVAVNCNKDKKVLYGILAFMFSDIYLLQWSIKKYVLKTDNYCE